MRYAGRLAAAAMVACLLGSLLATPAGATVVSTNATTVAAAPSVDIADATINATSGSSLEVAFNATGSAGSTATSPSS